MSLRVVSWNVRTGGRESVWRRLQELDPDIALLQEAAIPLGRLPGYRIFTSTPLRKSGKPQPWTLATLVREGLEAEQRTFSNPVRPWVAAELARWGACLCVTVNVLGGPVLIVNVLSPAWSVNLGPDATEHREEVRLRSKRNTKRVWLIDLVWAQLQDVLGVDDALLAGDFNSSILFDRKHGGYSSGNQETQDRLVALGLLDLVRVFSPPFDSTATFLTPGQRHARHQLDYMYATARIRDAARSCGIGPQDWEASDHLPIVAEFDGASGEPPLPRA